MDFAIQRGVSFISRPEPNWVARMDCLGDSAWTQWSAPSSSPALDGHHTLPPLARPGSARHAHSDRRSRSVPRRNSERVALAIAKPLTQRTQGKQRELLRALLTR